MILQKSYLEDLKDQLQQTDPMVFAAANTSLDQILDNETLMETLWISYQKLIEEFDMNGEEAYNASLASCLHIKLPRPQQVITVPAKTGNFRVTVKDLDTEYPGICVEFLPNTPDTFTPSLLFEQDCTETEMPLKIHMWLNPKNEDPSFTTRIPCFQNIELNNS